MTWHDSSDKCVLLHQNKRRKHFQEASYSVANSDNPHSSLHAVPPLMFLRYHCITDIYEVSQLIFSQQHTGKELLINTETISWVKQKEKRIFSTLIGFLLHVLSIVGGLTCDWMERKVTPCYNESERLKLARQHQSALLLPFLKSCRRWEPLSCDGSGTKTQV